MPPINYYPNVYQPYGGYQYLPQIPQAQPIPQYTQAASAPTQASQISTGILWVGNEQEAQSYPVAPNNAVALWDSANPVIYLKQADASGKPTIKIYELKERLDPSAEASKPVQNANYAEKSELESLKNELKNIKKELTALKRKQEDEDD